MGVISRLKSLIIYGLLFPMQKIMSFDDTEFASHILKDGEEFRVSAYKK